MRFDHIGIVVSDLAHGRQVLQDALGLDRWTQSFTDPVNDVLVQFGTAAEGPCYELVAPLSPASPVRRALRTGSNITNHVAYLVGDLDAQAARLFDQAFAPVAEARPAVAYGNARIQFFMSPIFSLIELIEAPGHRHHYELDATLAGIAA